MDTVANEKDYALLNSDKYTFTVLTRLLGGNNTLLLTDHERMIICFSVDPFPVWIWTAEDATGEELEKVYGLLRENGLMDGKHRFNIRYELADFLIRRAAEDGVAFVIETNMFAYDCPVSIEPTPTDGHLYPPSSEADIDEIVEFMDLFHHDIDTDYESMEEYRRKAEQAVKNRGIYFWQNAEGKNVASCTWHPIADMAAIGLVYTRPDERRKHYAENLVYQVTNIAREAGFMPMLYTDADYVASNACYEKIGYILRGKLCTIAPGK